MCSAGFYFIPDGRERSGVKSGKCGDIAIRSHIAEFLRRGPALAVIAGSDVIQTCPFFGTGPDDAVQMRKTVRFDGFQSATDVRTTFEIPLKITDDTGFPPRLAAIARLHQ